MEHEGGHRRGGTELNIANAKQVIKDTVLIYLKKTDDGDYCIPVVRQRPIFMIGAPGIGKTAIMEQIASELGIALVSYSMTHHTRQSALGLPYITKKEFGGEEYPVTEYTMSEIISSVYETIEKSGIKEGILFLDEINCVSETLGPSMLQFLQYKTFGRHSVPEGWVIVTAGNPPEYNRSVREFDVATLDRLKVISVDPDLKIWREYAYGRNIHGAVLGYLDVKKDDFYVMEMSPQGRSYVTARGWEDLSEMLKLCEEEEITADETLISQYLRCERVSKDFAAYYDMYKKYKKDYRIADILAGSPSPGIIGKASNAGFDERLSVLGMLFDSVCADMRTAMEKADLITAVNPVLKSVKAKSSEGGNCSEVTDILRRSSETAAKRMHSLKTAGALSDEERKILKGSAALYDDMIRACNDASCDSASGAFSVISQAYEKKISSLKKEVEKSGNELSNMISFVREAYKDGNEPVILATKLTSDPWSSRFIASFGSRDYEELAKDMELSERGNDLKEKILKLDL